MKHDVIIVGAGIAGLTAAFTLKKAGYSVLLLERATETGGLIQTAMDQEFLCEFGPNTFLPSAKPLLKLVSKLGLESELIQSATDQHQRYIFKNGRLQELFTTPLQFLKSPLISWWGKLRLLWEPFAKGPPSDRDESVSEFVSRRLGREIRDTLADPMVSGIIAGDVRQLSASATFPKLVALEKQHKGLFRGMRELRKKKKAKQSARLISFRNGMSTLIKGIESQLSSLIQYGVHIEHVAQQKDRSWEIRFTQDQKSHTHTAASILFATPAHTTSSLLAPVLPDVATPLAAIPYAPVTVLHLGFKNSDLPATPPGFGYLVPRNQGIRLLGTIWSSQLFPNRAPINSSLLTLMYGGATDPEIAEVTDNDLLKLALHDLQKTMKVDARPSFVRIRRHIRAIPQYTIGHENRIAHSKTLLMSKPGLFLTGNYINGYSVSDTIENALSAATEIAEYLTAHRIS